MHVLEGVTKPPLGHIRMVHWEEEEEGTLGDMGTACWN